MITEIEERYIQAVEKVSASVVCLRNGIAPRGPCCGPRNMGSGSGFVLNKEGYILTSHHVVSQMDTVTVLMNNGHVFTGKVVGEDRRTGIALVKVESDELVPAELGDSDALKVGQPILAVGNPHGLPGGPMVTSGVISFLPRGLSKGHGEVPILATDATVNSGNNGGLIVSLDGKIVAVNATRAHFAEGMSHAVPINKAMNIAEQLMKHGMVQRARLGVTAYDVTPPLAYQFQLPDTDGVFIAEIAPQEAAEAAGLRMGDVLLSLDDHRLANVSDLMAALDEMKPDQEIVVKFRRNGREEVVHVTLGTHSH